MKKVKCQTCVTMGSRGKKYMSTSLLPTCKKTTLLKNANGEFFYERRPEGQDPGIAMGKASGACISINQREDGEERKVRGPATTSNGCVE
jgi:hypothetical protein